MLSPHILPHVKHQAYASSFTTQLSVIIQRYTAHQLASLVVKHNIGIPKYLYPKKPEKPKAASTSTKDFVPDPDESTTALQISQAL